MADKVIIRKGYDRVRFPGIVFPDPKETKAQQHFKDECDINIIMKKYKRSGLIDHVNRYQGTYSDLSNPVDYQTAMQIVIDAQEAFESLPGNIRKRFGNDPEEFLQFVNDEANIDEMRSLGLLPAVEPQPVTPAADPEPTPPQEG